MPQGVKLTLKTPLSDLKVFLTALAGRFPEKAKTLEAALVEAYSLIEMGLAARKYAQSQPG